MIGMSAKRIIVIFRNDDPSALMDLAHEREIFGLFERYGVPQSLGVVPCITRGKVRDPRLCGEETLLADSPAAEFLREYVRRSGSEVALHGLTHRTHPRSQPSRREFFEFRLWSLKEQEDMLTKGAEVIERALRVRPITFIPPWNRMDQNTVLACSRIGLRIVSSGPYFPVRDGVVSVGCNANISNFQSLLARARSGNGPALIHVLFHSRTVVDATEKQLLAEAVASAARDSDCRAMTIAQVADEFPELVRRFNQAGASVADLHEIWGTARSRAHVYRPLLSRMQADYQQSSPAQQARNCYEVGDYDQCVSLLASVERRSCLALWAFRILLLMVGISAGLGVDVLHRAVLGTHARSMLWAIPSLFLFAGWFASRRLIATDSRREVLLAAGALAMGTAIGVCVPLLMRA